MNEQNTKNDVLTIDLWTLMNKLWKKAWIILVVTIIAGLLAFVRSGFIVERIYESSTKVYILNKPTSTGIPTYNDWMMSIFITGDYVDLIKSDYVMEKTIEELNLDMTPKTLKNKVNVYSGEESRILEIIVQTNDPQLSSDIANKVREISSERIVEIMNIDAVNVVDEAKPSTVPVSPDVDGDVIKGAAIGFIVSIVVLVVLFVLDDSLYTVEDIKTYLDLSVLGTLPYEGDPGIFKNNKFKKKLHSSLKK